jgi:hypothetical protein
MNGTCSCSNCYFGEECKFHFSQLGLSLPNLMLADTSSSPIIYLILIILIAIIGLLNNSLALFTFTRERIRITQLGVYLIISCICSFILMLFIALYIPALLYFDSLAYNEFHCHIQFYTCLALNYIFIWGSVAIMIEKVLIECLNFNMYESRTRSIVISIIIIIFVVISLIPEGFSRGLIEIPFNKKICTYYPNSNSIWYRMHIVFSYIHIILPCSIHLICMLCIINTIVRRKIFIAINIYPQQRRYKVWLRQFYLHRDFLILPISIIICILPHTIVHYRLISKCATDSFDLNPLRLHIALVLILNVPQMLTFLLYVYPNEIYLKEFMQTFVYRIICPASYQRQMEEQRRARAPSAVSLYSTTNDEL